MLLSGAQLLGPVARRLICPERWTDAYPAWESFAQELDALLEYADAEGGLHHLAPRLESKNAQRDEALEELRVAYWLHNWRFPVVRWEPRGLGGKVGEYLISTPEKKRVFVEVKSPGWEGQLSNAERQAGRAKQPKYQNLEGGAVGNWIPLQKCIASAKTYPKFAPTQPNLLVVADDLMVPLHYCLDHVEVALYNRHPGYGTTGYFNSPSYENLGGVGIFRAFSGGRGVEYEFKIFDNPFALPATKLPASLMGTFKEKKTGIVRATFTGNTTRHVF
ncbi:MAG TPA: hypothetical protein VKD23_16370 [Terriglobales bacterium]|nr:hypothetical protein [Terriglobales bacterium]